MKIRLYGKQYNGSFKEVKKVRIKKTPNPPNLMEWNKKYFSLISWDGFKNELNYFEEEVFKVK